MMQMRMERDEPTRPFIPKTTIEHDAEALLAQFSHARNWTVSVPIPIDDIIEKYLKLSVEFGDLHGILGVPRSGLGREPDIFGAIWLETGEIIIDESLDPEEHPSMEGRYRYTLAHEGGVGIGGCIVGSFDLIASKNPSLGRHRRPSYAGRVKRRKGWSGRPTSMLRAC
jgi:hypothetical protein